MTASRNRQPLCTFDRVSKWYGPVIGLNDVSIQVGVGITGLVGHNGAGKSTFMKLMTGQLRPSLGAVQIAGHAACSSSAKRFLGYCPDVDAFYEEMSGRAFVQLIAQLHGFSRRQALDRTEAVLSQVGMAERADRRLGTYSKGMRQRIKLAQAIVHDPALLVLDEPLNGVDPVGRLELIQLLKTWTAQGKAIVISSHILDDLDTLADQIVFICRGRVLASGTLASIREMLDEYPLQVQISTASPRSLAVGLLSLESVRSVELCGTRDLVVEVVRAKEFYFNFAELVVRQKVDIDRLQVLDSSTEAVFDYLMESALRPQSRREMA